MGNDIDDHLKPTRFAVFRGYDAKPGCVDYLGDVTAIDIGVAQDIAEKTWPEERGEYLMVEIDDEEQHP